MIADDLAAQFTSDWANDPDLGDVWVISTQEELTAFTRVTVIVSRQSIGPFPQAPQAKRTVGVTLEIVSPLSGRDEADRELEPIVLAILDYLDPRYQHDAAVTFLYGEQFAYRIPISVVANKESTNDS